MNALPERLTEARTLILYSNRQPAGLVTPQLQGDPPPATPAPVLGSVFMRNQNRRAGRGEDRADVSLPRVSQVS